MRTAITLGWKHGGKSVDLLDPPNVSLVEQRQKFKQLNPDGFHSTYERIEVWESDSGVVRSRKFSADSAVEKDVPKPADTKAKGKDKDAPKA